ncbi:MAG: peptidoglycan-binding protein [Neomegalonema sp.]|nr:peptidoglycan-binding protein [Neomegalonema sp.]
MPNPVSIAPLHCAARAAQICLSAVMLAAGADSAAAQSETDVLRVQTRLLKLGYSIGAPDGVLGPATKRAVRRYQNDWGLRVDGEVDPSLVAKLAAPAPAEAAIKGRSDCVLSRLDPRPKETITWSGACVKGKPEGEGVLVRRFRLEGRRAEVRYEGGMKDGEPSGRGVMIGPKKRRYVGHWLRGQRHGVGEEVKNSGVRYTGEWRFDLYEGQGRLTTPKGLTYQGGWKGGFRDGKGVETYKNGDRYEGDFVFDARDGKGVYSFKSGASYDGAWSRGLPEGAGVYRTRKGRTISGVWAKGCLTQADATYAVLVKKASCAR